MTQNNNNALFLTNLWVDQMVLLSHVVYIWNPGIAKKHRMVSTSVDQLDWLQSLCGFSAYLLELPHKMAVRFQKAASQEAKAYATNL